MKPDRIIPSEDTTKTTNKEGYTYDNEIPFIVNQDYLWGLKQMKTRNIVLIAADISLASKAYVVISH